MRPSSSYEKMANLIFPPLSSLQFFCSPVKASQQKCPLYICLVIVAGTLLSLLRMDQGAQANKALVLGCCSQRCSGRGSSPLQRASPAQLFPRWVQPKGMGVLWGKLSLNSFCTSSLRHVLLKAKVNKKTGFLQKHLILWALPILREYNNVSAPEKDLISS